jgi:hypothetical protein
MQLPNAVQQNPNAIVATFAGSLTIILVWIVAMAGIEMPARSRVGLHDRDRGAHPPRGEEPPERGGAGDRPPERQLDITPLLVRSHSRRAWLGDIGILGTHDLPGLVDAA